MEIGLCQNEGRYDLRRKQTFFYRPNKKHRGFEKQT